MASGGPSLVHMCCKPMMLPALPAVAAAPPWQANREEEHLTATAIHHCFGMASMTRHHHSLQYAFTGAHVLGIT
eukprot:1157718-Pelagomonas_calceolata.AAC.9